MYAFLQFFYKMSKDCSLLSNKQAGHIDKIEILLNLFISIFNRFFREDLFQTLCYEKFGKDFSNLSSYFFVLHHNHNVHMGLNRPLHSIENLWKC